MAAKGQTRHSLEHCEDRHDDGTNQPTDLTGISLTFFLLVLPQYPTCYTHYDSGVGVQQRTDLEEIGKKGKKVQRLVMSVSQFMRFFCSTSYE